MIDVTTSDHHGHWDVEDIKRLCEYRDQLRGNLSLAEEGLANYAQEVEQLKAKLASVRVRCLNLAQWLHKGCDPKHAVTELGFIALHAKESSEPQEPPHE